MDEIINNEPVLTPMAHLLSDMEAAAVPEVAPPAAPDSATPPAEDSAASGVETPAQPPEGDPGMPPIPNQPPVNPPVDYLTRQDLAASNEELLQKILNARAPEPEAQPPAEEPVEEDIHFDIDAFYDNPDKVLNEAVQRAAEKKAAAKINELETKLKPLLDQSEAAQLKETIRGVANDFLSNTEDGKDYFQDVLGYIKENGLDPKSPQSYLDGYREAKIGRLGGKVRELEAHQGKSLDDYLADETSIEQIVANDAIKKRIIEEYLSGLRDGEKPAVIGGDGTGQYPAQPRKDPRTLRDASNLLRRDLER